MRGELGFDESFTRRIALLKGLAAERVHSLTEAIPLAEGAERLVQTLRLLGYKTAILSGASRFLPAPFSNVWASTPFTQRTRNCRWKSNRRVIPPSSMEPQSDLLSEIARSEESRLSRLSRLAMARTTFRCSTSLAWALLIAPSLSFVRMPISPFQHSSRRPAYLVGVRTATFSRMSL